MRSTDRFSIEDVRCDVAGASLAVTNLSVGGFYVACEPPLPMGHSVAFDLVFGDGWRASVHARARVHTGRGSRIYTQTFLSLFGCHRAK